MNRNGGERMNPLQIGKNREVFWDDYLVDTARTTAEFRQIPPVWKEVCFTFDQGPELNSISYPCIVHEPDGYRMYYLPWCPSTQRGGQCMCVIESMDGLHWTRPALNIYDRPDMDVNNVVLEGLDDGIYVFKDTNPHCPPQERYKALTPKETIGDQIGGLWCYTSPDGYHFTKSHVTTTIGAFDSLNVAFWENGKYYCYLRNYHNIGPVWTDGIEDFNTRGAMTQWSDLNAGIRDVRVMYSTDFRNWTVPQQIRFDDGKDYPLYTNNIVAYPRAPHIKIGFPVRYVERKVWTPNYTQLASGARKKAITQQGGRHSVREGMAVTDAIFICSRDGELFHRNNEAYFTPGYEHERNWIYGDGYSAYNLIDSGRDVYYMYEKAYPHTPGEPKPLYRYEVRKDGFACRMATGEEKELVTKPFVFEGSKLHMNFQTSAWGHIYVDLLDAAGEPIPGKTSFELFGDTIDREVFFEDGSDFAEFALTPVRLRLRMLDAKVFAINFE